MAAAIFIVKCPTCGSEVKRDRQVIELEGKCPRCGGAIPAQPLGEQGPRRPHKDLPLGYESDDSEKRMLTVIEHDDVAVVSFSATALLDRSNVQKLGEELSDLVDEHGLHRIVLDFANIHYMSSTVMSKLVAFREKVKAAEGHLRLCRIDDEILEVFRIMRYEKLFVIQKSEADAIKSMPRG